MIWRNRKKGRQLALDANRKYVPNMSPSGLRLLRYLGTFTGATLSGSGLLSRSELSSGLGIANFNEPSSTKTVNVCAQSQNSVDPFLDGDPPDCENSSSSLMAAGRTDCIISAGAAIS